ncbi:glycosyltransferase [Nocardioides sp. 31GB23]|uniref:glycosyltransferase n=1 Tax=Nocardioides sp. 31GB23 TaxID=3156065 RepID=UPI0032AE9B37
MHISSLATSDGGPPNAVVNIASGLAKRGHDVTIVSRDESDATVHSPKHPNVRVVTLKVRTHTRFNFSIRYLMAAWRASRDATFVSTHGFYQFTCVTAWIIARARRIPLVVQPHGVFESYQEQSSSAAKTLFMKVVGRRILNDSQRLMLASESEAAGALEYVEPAKIVVAGLGVDPADHAAAPQVRQGVVFLSRVAPKKRLDLLVEAMILVNEGRDVPVSLTICGDGGERFVAEMKSMTEDLPWVEWRGQVAGSGKSAALLGASLYALPSDNENFGQAIVEAMAHGTPVICTRACGASAHVERANAGWIIAEPSERKLADTIVDALSDSERLTEAGRNAVEYSQRYLTWANVARVWERECCSNEFS